jgi:hypothetical protein
MPGFSECWRRGNTYGVGIMCNLMRYFGTKLNAFQAPYRIHCQICNFLDFVAIPHDHHDIDFRYSPHIGHKLSNLILQIM